MTKQLKPSLIFEGKARSKQQSRALPAHFSLAAIFFTKMKFCNVGPSVDVFFVCTSF